MKARGIERSGRHYVRIERTPFWPTTSSVDQTRHGKTHKPRSEQDPDVKKKRRKAHKKNRKRTQPCCHWQRIKKCNNGNSGSSSHDDEFDEVGTWPRYECEMRPGYKDDIRPYKQGPILPSSMGMHMSEVKYQEPPQYHVYKVCPRLTYNILRAQA